VRQPHLHPIKLRSRSPCRRWRLLSPGRTWHLV